MDTSELDNYVISWELPDFDQLFTINIDQLASLEVVLGRLTFSVEIFSGDDWILLEDGVKECQCEWTDPDPSRQYYVRVTASNDFGSGAASRSTMVAEQVGEESGS